MRAHITSVVIFICLARAVLLGRWVRSILCEHHLNADTKDTVKLAMGLVAAMAALLLGLLVSSAKGSYDTIRSEVIHMAAKAAFLDRVLNGYEPEAAAARALYRKSVEENVARMSPTRPDVPADLTPHTQAGNAVYLAIEQLSPQDDAQRNLKAQATSLIVELGQLRTLLAAQSVASISHPLLIVVVAWLVVHFVSFSVLAPPNATASLALMISALSVADNETRQALQTVISIVKRARCLLECSADQPTGQP
jgi:hypothetical protein